MVHKTTQQNQRRPSAFAFPFQPRTSDLLASNASAWLGLYGLATALDECLLALRQGFASGLQKKRSNLRRAAAKMPRMRKNVEFC